MNSKESHLSDYIRKLNQVNPIEFQIKNDILFKHASSLLDEDKTPNDILSSLRNLKKNKIVLQSQPFLDSIKSKRTEKQLFLKKFNKPLKEPMQIHKIAATCPNSIDSSNIKKITKDEVCSNSVLKGKVIRKCIENLNKTQLGFIRVRQKELAASNGKRANDLKYVLDDYFSDNYHQDYFNDHNQFAKDLSLIDSKKKNLPEIKSAIESIEKVTTEIHIANIHLSNDIAFINKTLKRLNNGSNRNTYRQKSREKKAFTNPPSFKSLSYYEFCACANQKNPLLAVKIKREHTPKKIKDEEFNEYYLNCFSEGSYVNTDNKINKQKKFSLIVSRPSPTPREIQTIKQDKKLNNLLNTCSMIERTNKRLKYKLKRVKK